MRDNSICKDCANPCRWKNSPVLIEKCDKFTKKQEPVYAFDGTTTQKNCGDYPVEIDTKKHERGKE